MCCRINSSGRGARIIVGLYIFLATFLIGFFAVQLVRWSDGYSPAAGTDQIPFQVESPIIADPVYESPLKVEYRCSLMGVDSLDAIFEVTNDGSETIHFPTDKDSGKLPITMYVRSELSREIMESISIPTESLKPAQSTYFSVRLPPKSNGFNMSFQYWSGNQSPRDISVHTDRQIKSFTCTGE